MKRRDFLIGSAAGAALAATWPDGARAQPRGPRLLILVELEGGNDGLNTIIPYADRRYGALRPNLKIARERVIALDERLGLHPALAPLMPAWRAREAAIIAGVGYPGPNFSHFRSIEIWDTASGSRRVENIGWLAKAVAARPPRGAAEMVVFGRTHAGPMAGLARNVMLEDPFQFANAARTVPEVAARPTEPALAHIVQVQSMLRQAGEEIHARLTAGPASPGRYAGTRFGTQLQFATRLLAAGTQITAIKLSQPGFDTHVNQRAQHDWLLGDLAQGLAALREALIALGLWDRTLVMTYSEFGRRAEENGNAGTDHGTAAPVLIMGGGVRGGFHGSQPSLIDLENGNLRFSVDYRAVVAEALRWWGVDPTAVLPQVQARIGFV